MTTQPTTPDTARAEADADPVATLAALRKTWGARERDLAKRVPRQEQLDLYTLAEMSRVELRKVQELLDFIGRD